MDNVITEEELNLGYEEYVAQVRREQAEDLRVVVSVKDRPLMHELARTRIEIDRHFEELATGRVRSRILSAAPHLAWQL